MNLKDKNIILYDGYCNLCNFTLKFILRQDKKRVFKYYPIQSKEAINLLFNRIAYDNIQDSVILLERGQIYLKSEAFFKILPYLGRGYNLLLVFKILPKKFADIIYDWIADNRYRWFGKRDQCNILQDTN
ncbi:MAG: DCC1-like thiol-disulfide oxidoreductase family protein [Bacteroidales bacterium]|nr:DCC1-like thiol-disulfide oxidoreductase family protein [Bacteroidales bacterium]